MIVILPAKCWHRSESRCLCGHRLKEHAKLGEASGPGKPPSDKCRYDGPCHILLLCMVAWGLLAYQRAVTCGVHFGVHLAPGVTTALLQALTASASAASELDRRRRICGTITNCLLSSVVLHTACPENLHLQLQERSVYLQGLLLHSSRGIMGPALQVGAGNANS
jgi:hypothetical protein